MLAPTENMIPDIVYKVDAKKLSALISVKRDIKIDRIGGCKLNCVSKE